MPLDSKLQKRRLANNTYVDDMSADKKESPLNTLMPVLAASAGLYTMYKKGMLQPLVKSGMEVFESIAKTSSDKAYMNLKGIEDWTKLEHYSKEKLQEMGYRIPNDSIFRGNNLNKLKRFSNDTINELKNGSINLGYARKIINDSVEDISQLKKMISETSDKTEAYRKKYYDTDLISGVKELKRFSKEVYANAGPEAQILVGQESVKEFIKMNSLTLDEEKRLFKINGYRPIMLQDIMDKPERLVDGEYLYKPLENSKINLKDNTGTQVYNSAQELFGVMGNSNFKYLNSNGKISNMIEDWDNTKRLVLDKNILIDNSGNIIDLRMSDDMLKWTKEIATKHFQIPGLGFNPLTSLLPKWGNAKSREAKFGLLYKGSVQPILTGKAGTVGLEKDIFVLNGKGFSIIDSKLEQVADGIKLIDISRADKYGLNKKVDTIRKMSGNEYYTYKLKDNVKQEIESGSLKGKFYDFIDKANKWLDSGKPDNYIHKGHFNPDGERLDVGDEWNFTPDIDNWITNSIYNITKKFNIYDISESKTPGTVLGTINPLDYQDEITHSTTQTRKFIATKKGRSVFKILEQDGITGKLDYTKDYLKEIFIGGRKADGTISEYTTDTTIAAYNLFDNVFGRLNAISPQLGFSTESKGNLSQYIKNIALKRVLPIYAATQVPGILNAMSEPIFNLFNDNEDGTDNKNNITKFTMSNIVKPLDLGLHKVKDILGITKLTKTIEEFTPGFDQINELPGIYHLGLNQTFEERKEYIENGFDPMRKARYWGLGNTPFTGGKIMYWRPNIYRRVEADVDFSDSKWGSRQEYYSNTWFPNPINPLAPINYFLLDKNHYDKKHYYDRPYLLTSKQGNNIPIIGPLYSSTIGSVISPQKRMHEEYWQDNRPIERDDENVAIIDYVNNNASYSKQVYSNNAFINSQIITGMNNTYKASQQKDGYARVLSIKQAQAVSQHDSSPQNIISGNILPSQTDNTFSSYVSNLSNLEIYTTPSGNSSLVDIPASLTTWEANQRLKEYSIKRFPEADTRVGINDDVNMFNPQLADYTNEKINNSFIYGLGDEFNTLSDFFGMKGFETQAFITGEANIGAKQIEDSNYAYSFNKDFWDQNLGGLGGDASEIFRRFVQKRDTGTEFINPIRNTMPSWMPGRNYFTDFKHGDIYSKIDNGEERLPGEGYERLYGINSKRMFELGIGSSYIGKSKEDIQKHLLNQDSFSSYAMDVMEEGTQIHEKVEKQWLESGLAINTEGRVEDKQNNILGFYDAMVHDRTSRTGKAIVDIKTVGDKKFQRIVAQGHADFEHQSQTNYYLWATGNKRSNGYIYYINRDNPEQTYTTGFKFSPELLQQNLNTLNQARNEIYTGLENGTIGRGELYSDIDRLRILADVAPYSDEFQSVKAKLANQDLTPEEQLEISQINERIKQQKEPLRVYPYKFKTSNLQTERVRVKKVIDNNTILVNRYGTDHAIKFAGIRVSESNTNKYDKNTTMNEAAAKELRKHIKKGKSITIAYDFDDANKFKKDSTESIRAVVYSGGTNVNQTMLNKGLATEKDDDSPAGIRARYTKNEIAFGSAMERITHGIGSLPFIGNKFFQVKSPYEQYRDREVYGKIC